MRRRAPESRRRRSYSFSARRSPGSTATADANSAAASEGRRRRRRRAAPGAASAPELIASLAVRRTSSEPRRVGGGSSEQKTVAPVTETELLLRERASPSATSDSPSPSLHAPRGVASNPSLSPPEVALVSPPEVFRSEDSPPEREFAIRLLELPSRAPETREFFFSDQAPFVPPMAWLRAII